MNFPFRYGINSLLLNNKGKKFLAAEFMLGVEPRRTTYTPWFQLNCAQLPPDPRNLMRPMCANQSGQVTVMAPAGSRAGVLFDLDNDGDLDLVTSDFNSAPQVLVSNLAQVRSIHWLKVQLIGAASNRDGLGALVKVETAHGTYTKQHDGKSGYLSQSSLPLVFRPGRRYRRHSRGSPLAIRTQPGDRAGTSRSNDTLRIRGATMSLTRYFTR